MRVVATPHGAMSVVIALHQIGTCVDQTMRSSVSCAASFLWPGAGISRCQYAESAHTAATTTAGLTAACQWSSTQG